MKPGWMTSEFWLAALVAVGSLLSSVAGGMQGEAAAIVAAIATAIYTIARTLAKSGKSAGAVKAETHRQEQVIRETTRREGEAIATKAADKAVGVLLGDESTAQVVGLLREKVAELRRAASEGKKSE